MISRIPSYAVGAIAAMLGIQLYENGVNAILAIVISLVLAFIGVVVIAVVKTAYWNWKNKQEESNGRLES